MRYFIILLFGENMEITDSHVHIFPYLGGKLGYKSKALMLLYAQKLISEHKEKIRKLEDYSISNEGNIWDEDKPGINGKREVDFKVGKYGRYQWTINGSDYFKQYMPVHLQNMSSPPEFIITQMNYVGIKKAILQRGHMYGDLDEYYYSALRRYPDRLIGLIQLDESRAYCEDQIDKLNYSTSKLGLMGI